MFSYIRDVTALLLIMVFMSNIMHVLLYSPVWRVEEEYDRMALRGDETIMFISGHSRGTNVLVFVLGTLLM